jgi:hypothetical protein|tara:strand:+ start:364 stop:525 length:162 start_codon:yes stop_codon:yes gene_type:complete
MGIFNNELTKPLKTTAQLVHEVRVTMSKELGMTLTPDQAVERLCNIFLAETTQ